MPLGFVSPCLLLGFDCYCLMNFENRLTYVPLSNQAYQYIPNVYGMKRTAIFIIIFPTESNQKLACNKFQYCTSAINLQN